MKEKMKFSFILPAYKGLYLEKSISSILAQNYQDFELIVVDDCSPDPIKDITLSFNDDRISYFRNEENIGGKDLVAQWTHCLEYAHGDYFILATDDDVYERNFLSSFIPLIDKYPEVKIFRSRIMDIDAEGNILWFDRCMKEYLSQGEFYYHYFQGIKGGIPQFIFKRDDFIQGGGFVSFPLAWGSDDATALKFSRNGIVNSQNMLVRFRWSGINISSNDSKDSKKKKIEARILLCKWLKKQIPSIIFEQNDIGRHCHNYVVNGIDVNIKRILLKEVITADFCVLIYAIKRLYKEKIVSNKNLVSIFYRYLKT